MKFWISGFLDFWISGFFWISGYILATEKATGVLLVSKRPDFLGLFGFPQKMYFWISGFFFNFWLFLDIGKSYRRFASVKTTGFKKNTFGFVVIWIFGFLDFLISGSGSGSLVSKRPIFLGLLRCVRSGV